MCGYDHAKKKLMVLMKFLFSLLKLLVCVRRISTQWVPYGKVWRKIHILCYYVYLGKIRWKMNLELLSLKWLEVSKFYVFCVIWFEKYVKEWMNSLCLIGRKWNLMRIEVEMKVKLLGVNLE
jgi:hypothetical protein